MGFNGKEVSELELRLAGCNALNTTGLPGTAEGPSGAATAAASAATADATMGPPAEDTAPAAGSSAGDREVTKPGDAAESTAGEAPTKGAGFPGISVGEAAVSVGDTTTTDLLCSRGVVPVGASIGEPTPVANGIE